MSDSYPADDRRDIQLFALQYSKQLLESDILRLSSESLLLVLFVAAREDRLCYAKAPQFWRAEIMERFGWKSPKQFVKAVETARDAGLLHYSPGDRHTPGRFWVLVPSWMDLDPFRKRNGKPSIRSESGTANPAIRSENGTANPAIRSENGTANALSRSENGTGGGTLSTPIPQEVNKRSKNDSFESWWNHYPRKVAKKDAAKAFTKAMKEISKRSIEDPIQWMIDRTKAFAQSQQDLEFCPYPASWLNAGRYDDDPHQLEIESTGRRKV